MTIGKAFGERARDERQGGERILPRLRSLVGSRPLLLARVRFVVVAMALASLMWWIGRLFLRVAIQHHAVSAFFASRTWGALILLSFAGWGSAINVALFPRQAADWGLRCAWGWGAVVAVGGTLCACGLAKSGALIGVVALGLLLLFAAVGRAHARTFNRVTWRRERRSLAELPFTIGVAAASLLGIGQSLASIQASAINANDDSLCYFAFAKEILERGTLTQSFSLRRLSAYGAKSVLDAVQIAIPVPTGHLRMLDSGLAVLTVMALIVGSVRTSRWSSRAIVLMLLLLVATIPEIRINTAATMTGVVFFLGLYRTLTWPVIQRAAGWRSAVPVALLAAGACALRQNYLVPIAALLVLTYGMPIVQSALRGQLRLRSHVLRDALAAMALLVVFLVPWGAMSQRWVHTFLFPFIKGNFNASYPFFEPLTRFQQLHYIWANVTYGIPVKAVPLFLVAALTAVDRTGGGRLAYFVLATFVGFAALIKGYPDCDAPNMGRYYFGFTFAALVAIGLGVAEVATRGGGSPRVRAARTAAVPLVLAGIALQLYSDRDETGHVYDKYLTTIQEEYDHAAPWVVPPERDSNYALLQDAVPAGVPIAVMVDEPYRFDFVRNPIESLDIVGAAGPAPGIPILRGADAVADYLVSIGYKYAIVVLPEAATNLYRRDRWKEQEANGLPIWKHTAPFYEAAFNAFDELRATRVHYADVASMATIDLTRRKPQ